MPKVIMKLAQMVNTFGKYMIPKSMTIFLIDLLVGLVYLAGIVFLGFMYFLACYYLGLVGVLIPFVAYILGKYR
jgi:hypothetical protein